MHLKGGALFNQNTPESNKAAQKLFEDALALEPKILKFLVTWLGFFGRKFIWGFQRIPLKISEMD